MSGHIQDTELFKFFQKHQDIWLGVLVKTLDRASESYSKLNNIVLAENKINYTQLFNGDYVTSLTSTTDDIVMFFNTPFRGCLNALLASFREGRVTCLGPFISPFQSLKGDREEVIRTWNDIVIGYDEYSPKGEIKTFTDFINHMYSVHVKDVTTKKLKDLLLDVEYFVRLQGFYPNVGRDLAIHFIKSFCEALSTDVDREMFRAAFYSDRYNGYWSELFDDGDLNPFIFDLVKEYSRLIRQRKDQGLEVKVSKVEREDKEDVKSSNDMNLKEGDNMENLNGLRSVNNKENENNEGVNSTPDDAARRTFERVYLGSHPVFETRTKTEEETVSSFWKKAGIVAGGVLAAGAVIVVGKSIWNKITSDSKPTTDSVEMFEEA